MNNLLKATIAMILLATPAFAVGNSNVNVTINSSTVDSDRVAEVEVGGDTYQFPDPFTAPELSQAGAALDAGLTELGHPAGTSATVQEVLPIGTDETVEEAVTSSHNPTDDPTFVIGDPDDYSTWIAIGPEDVEVYVDLTTTRYTFYRLVAAITPPCGDGTMQAGETCDDGNTDDGDCCSSTCQYETSGSACDDGVACTALDSCDGVGTCQSGGPATTCVSSWAKATLLVNEKKTGKEKFIAKVKGGPALAQGDFGNPDTGSTDYDICVFDDAGDLVVSMSVDRAGGTCAGKPCWKPKKDTGWKYKDKDAASDGVTTAKLFGGDPGKTQFQVQAANNQKKGQLSMPTGIAAALQGSASATLQFLASDALCFEVTLDEIKKQEADFFKAVKK